MVDLILLLLKCVDKYTKKHPHWNPMNKHPLSPPDFCLKNVQGWMPARL